MSYQVEFSNRRHLDDEEMIVIANRILQFPDEQYKITIIEDPFVSIGGLTTLGLLKKTHPDNIEIDINRIGQACLSFIDRMGLINEGSMNSNFPLQHIQAGIVDGNLYAKIPKWLERFASREFGYNHASLGEVQQACYELINNVVDHSLSPTGGMICGSYFPNHNNLQISVVDFGISIPKSLGPHLASDNWTDDAIINESLKPNVSRRLGLEHNYGMGLDLIKTYALSDSGCSLKIISRDGFVSVTRELAHARRSDAQFPGTFVRLCLSKTFLERSIEINSETSNFDL